jgi:integrase
MKRAARFKTGSVVEDRRRKTWNFLWWENGKRRTKGLGQHSTKTSAWKAAKLFRDALETKTETAKPVPTVSPIASPIPTVNTLVSGYRAEKMPTRFSSRRSYEAWFRNHIVPKFGDALITDVQARPVEMWLKSLQLSPKSRGQIRGLLSALWDFAMWRGEVPTQRNPMELVTIKGSSKRTRKPRSLAVEEFHKLTEHLAEPFRTIALLCVCFGLRISEALALKWIDVDWLNAKLSIQRGIVRQHVDDVKTEGSERAMSVDAELMAVLKAWKQTTEFSGPDDWVFASPVQLGRLPWSADSVNDAYLKAATAANIGHVSSHSMRHSYRSWLDAVGTSVAVQQKLMRHADVRTTMNTYGDVVTDEMAQASSKVVRLAIPQVVQA